MSSHFGPGPHTVCSVISRAWPALVLLGLASCGGGGGGSGAPATYGVGGSISGLTGSGLTLASGGNAASPSAGSSSFSLSGTFVSGSKYTVTVTGQPAGQACTVANGSGTVGSANVTNVR